MFTALWQAILEQVDQTLSAHPKPSEKMKNYSFKRTIHCLFHEAQLIFSDFSALRNDNTRMKLCLNFSSKDFVSL